MFSSKFIKNQTCALVLSAAAAAACAAQLPPELAAAAKNAGITETSLGLWVSKAGADKPVLSVNSRRPMNPASVMKVVTTYAALDLLGPAHRETTTLYSAAGIDEKGVLREAFLKGTGDAHFVAEDVWLFAERLAGLGVKRIAGNIAADRTAFDAASRVEDQGSFDGAASRPYNVGPDPLAANFKTVSLTFTPQTQGLVRVSALPRLSGITVPETIRGVKGFCGDVKAKVGVTLEGGTIRFAGSYPVSCGVKTVHYALFDENVYLTGILRDALARAGITWSGRIVDGEVPARAKAVASTESAPLSQTVTWINKFSNNAMARQLFMTLSFADADGMTRPATLARSRAVVTQWLQTKGINPKSVTIDNGSGLSRTARISAETLGRVLNRAWVSPVMPEMMASLPAAGVDGTMKKRGLKTGSAHIKTGYLKDSRSVAGWVTTPAGDRYTVVMMVNSKRPDGAKAFSDAVLAWCAGRR